MDAPRRCSHPDFACTKRQIPWVKFLKLLTVYFWDTDDLVQKGYGWMLKEASKKHQTQVFNYIMKNKAKMPRTALRYAIEKMPVELKKQAMKK